MTADDEPARNVQKCVLTDLFPAYNPNDPVQVAAKAAQELKETEQVATRAVGSLAGREDIEARLGKIE